MFDIDIKFIGDGISSNFYDVLPKRLTLQNIKPMWHQPFRGYTEDTIFKEVKIIKYNPTIKIKDFLKTSHNGIDSVNELYYILKTVVEKRWDSSKVHVIGHSSGYDSRTLSNIVKELGEKNGKDWLGEVIYVETLGESEIFKRIMEERGTKGISYNDGVKPSMFHEYSFRFNDYYKKFNGIVSFPINQWYDAYMDLERQGILNSSNVQCFTGYGADETMELAHRRHGFGWYFKWHHYIQIQNFNFWGDNWVFPYWDLDFLAALHGFKKALRYHNRIAQVMADAMVSDLKHIPAYKLDTLKEYRKLDNSILMRVQSDYDKSWYGKRNKIKIYNDFTDYRTWWTHYGIASACEYLLTKGHIIK